MNSSRRYVLYEGFVALVLITAALLAVEMASLLSAELNQIPVTD